MSRRLYDGHHSPPICWCARRISVSSQNASFGAFAWHGGSWWKRPTRTWRRRAMDWGVKSHGPLPLFYRRKDKFCADDYDDDITLSFLYTTALQHICRHRRQERAIHIAHATLQTATTSTRPMRIRDGLGLGLQCARLQAQRPREQANTGTARTMPRAPPEMHVGRVSAWQAGKEAQIWQKACIIREWG